MTADKSRTGHGHIHRQVIFFSADLQQTLKSAFLKNADTQQTQTTAF